MKIHYAGGVEYRSRGVDVVVQEGWAACLRGLAAARVAAAGAHTWEPDEVTCSRCLRILAQVDGDRQVDTGSGGSDWGF